MTDTTAICDPDFLRRDELSAPCEELTCMAAELLCRIADTQLRLGRSCLVLAGPDADEREALLVLQIASLQGARPLVFVGSEAATAVSANERGADAAGACPAGSKPEAVLRELCRTPIEHVLCTGASAEWLKAAMAVAADDGEVVVLDGAGRKGGPWNFYPDLHRRQVALVGVDDRVEPSARQRRAAEWLVQSGRLRERD